MTASPTPEHMEHVYDNAAVKRTDNSSVWGSDLMRVPSLLIAPLGLLGNGVVLWLLGFRTRRTPFSVYILNLAAADALFLCCSLLDSIDDFVGYFHDLFNHEIMFNLRYLFYTAGLSLLAAISTERCLCALFPIWYRCHRPKHSSVSVCVVLWALIGSLWVNGLVTCSHISWHVLCRFNIFEGVCFIILTCVLCVSSLTLLLRVQCSSQRRRPPRLYLLVLLTVLVFLLCGLPWGIEDLIRYHLKQKLLPHWLFHLLACVNSSMNPLIYFFVGSQSLKRKREPFRVILQRVLGDEQELGGGTSDTPHTSIQETTL